MALALGLLLIFMGALLVWAWLGATVLFLKGLLAVSLVFWGVLSLIVGLAQFKSKRQLQAALHDEPSLSEKQAGD